MASYPHPMEIYHYLDGWDDDALKVLGKPERKDTRDRQGAGTWKLGEDPTKEINAIRAGLDAGMRFIDTAEMYGTEWVVAGAIKDRKDVFVATKVSPSHFSHNDVIKACDRSLNSLGVRQIDLYQLHWPNRSVPIRETMRAMEALVDAGKIRHIGVSNFTIKEFQKAQDSMARYEIVSNQVEYSILVDLEPGLLDFCNKEVITIIAYSPLAKGMIFNPKNKSCPSVPLKRWANGTTGARSAGSA